MKKFLVYGEDLGLLEAKISELTNSNFTRLILDSNYEEIYVKINQNSLFEDFDEQKIFVIYDFKKALSDLKNSESQKLLEFLTDLKNVTNKIFFVLHSKDINKEFINFFELINVKKLNKLTVKNYCLKLIRKYKVNITDNDFSFLLSLLPLDSLQIKNEIEKLSLVNEKISKDIIEKLISVDISKNIFELIDNFFKKNYERIIQQINFLEALKIDFLEIFNVMISQLFSLKLYRMNYLENKSYEKICKDFSIQMFQIEKWFKLISSVDILQIDAFLNNLIKLNIFYLSGEKQLHTHLKMILLNGGDYGL